MELSEVEKLAAEVETGGEGLPPAPSSGDTPAVPEQPQPQQPQPWEGQISALRAALHAERQRGREWRDKLEELQRTVAPKTPARPDPKVDPVGYLAWLETREGQQEKERQEREEGERKSAAERETQHEVMNAYLEAVDELQESTPDFNEAYAFLVKWGHDQLRQQGIRNPMQRAQQQAMFEFQFVQGALAKGLNPAVAVYQKAIELGWQKGAAAAPAAVDPQMAPAGAAPARDPATGQFVPQQLAAPPRSLSQARGGAPAALTPESVANMSNEEIDKRIKADPDWWRKLHGAR